jgi:tRNA G46 methylase TrmB
MFPGLAAGGDDCFTLRGRWAAHFRDRLSDRFPRRIVLEVGCADAKFLATVAARHPDVGFVGLDWKFKQIHDGAARLQAAGLKNVMLLRGRAADLPRIFAPGEIDEAWVFHPEPCDEPKQRANRLVTGPFLQMLAPLLRDDTATVAIKTDHVGYFQWVLGVMGEPAPPAITAALHAAATAAPMPTGWPNIRLRELLAADDVPARSPAAMAHFVVTAVSADFWNDHPVLARVSGCCYANLQTPFEQRFVQKHRPIYFVELCKRTPAVTE